MYKPNLFEYVYFLLLSVNVYFANGLKQESLKGKIIPKNLTVNILRKFAWTGICENNPKQVQQTCDTMCHSENTGAVHLLAKAKGIVCLLWWYLDQTNSKEIVQNIFSGSNIASIV